MEQRLRSAERARPATEAATEAVPADPVVPARWLDARLDLAA